MGASFERSGNVDQSVWLLKPVCWVQVMGITTVAYRGRSGEIEVLSLLVAPHNWPYMKTGPV